MSLCGFAWMMVGYDGEWMCFYTTFYSLREGYSGEWFESHCVND
jgi:hypothetical protein